AVQARVVVTGTGALKAYKEPSGPGVRVDGCGYVGYTPPPQFDPLLAKVIGSAPGPVAAAVDRTARALDEFHVAGLPTNLPGLRAILAHPAVRAGDARTTLLSEAPELLQAAAPGGGEGPLLALLDQQAGTRGQVIPAPAARPSLAVGAGQHAAVAPMDGTVLEVRG